MEKSVLIVKDQAVFRRPKLMLAVGKCMELSDIIEGSDKWPLHAICDRCWELIEFMSGESTLIDCPFCGYKESLSKSEEKT